MHYVLYRNILNPCHYLCSHVQVTSSVVWGYPVPMYVILKRLLGASYHQIFTNIGIGSVTAQYSPFLIQYGLAGGTLRIYGYLKRGVSYRRVRKHLSDNYLHAQHATDRVIVEVAVTAL